MGSRKIMNLCTITGKTGLDDALEFVSRLMNENKRLEELMSDAKGCLLSDKDDNVGLSLHGRLIERVNCAANILSAPPEARV